MTTSQPIPMEQPALHATENHAGTIGLPSSSNILDHRFAITPEGAALLIERGFRVIMEKGASAGIHYSDADYVRQGVEIGSRTDAFSCDIVIYLSDLGKVDARNLKRGCLFLSFEHLAAKDAPTVRTLLERKIIFLDLAKIADDNGRLIFADIIHEIDGRAAMAVASSLLADAVHGKGILLGGIAGVVPSEVMIIGTGVSAIAAAKSAIGMGATVRIFDNNAYSLRSATELLGSGAIGSSLHPRVFRKALSTADVVLVTDIEPRPCVIGSEEMRLMKKGVIAFDLSGNGNDAFPAMQKVNLDLASPGDTGPTEPTRLCYINAGNAVSRSMAMALSNTFVSMLDDILISDGVTNALKLNAGLRNAAITFLGQCVSARAAALLGLRNMDINLFIQFS